MNTSKPVVLFLIYHGKSHFNSCFHIARTIQQTHTVAFAGVEFFSGHVRSQGFTYFPLKSVPFGIGLERWYNTVTNRKPVYWKSVADRWSDRLYHVRKKELSQLVLTYNPTHILLDSLQSTDFIVLYNLISRQSISVGVVHNMFPSFYNKHFPPLNSLVTDNARAIQKASRTETLNKTKLRWKQRFRNLAPGDADIVYRRLKRNRIPPQFISSERSLFNFDLKGIPEFVLMPKEFDLPGRDLGSSLSFLGSQIDFDRHETVDPKFHEMKRMIDKEIPAGRELIYCAFGTLPPEDRPRVLAFIKKVIIATKDRNCMLIISFKFEVNEKENMPGDNNHVFIFDAVPQLEILTKTSLFITHGGLNSIKEAINAETPMLVYPFDSNYDLNGNTARVIHHGLGLHADTNDDWNTIKAKINELLTTRGFKERLRKFKAIDETYSIRPFLDFVSSSMKSGARGLD